MSYTPEEQEKIDKVRDLMQGGPRARLEKYALEEVGFEYEVMMRNAQLYVTSDGTELWDEGIRFISVGIYDRFWDDYELVTGQVVPQHLRDDFLTCTC